MECTVNELLSKQKMLKQRLSQLNEMKNQSTTRSIYRLPNNENKTEEPTYDIVDVDKKIVDIDIALNDIDTTVKGSNAVVKVKVDVDFEKLMSPLEHKK